MSIKLVEYSLSKNADLIIGQFINLNVDLISDENIPPSTTISFSSVKNITVKTTPIQLSISKDRKKAVAIVGISVKDMIQDGDPITFDIDTSITGFETGKFICTARKIAPESLTLTVDNKFLDLPKGPNDPSITSLPCSSTPGSTYCTKVHTVLTDPYGKKLSGVPVLISENRTGNLGRFHIYSADQKNRIKIEEVNGFDQMVINSDQDGNVIFYLYSQESLSAILELISMIQGVDYVHNATSPIYAISNKVQSSALRWPNIEGFWSGNLKSDGSPTFNVMITKYDNASHGDVIVFYVDDKRTEYMVRVDDPNKDLGSYSISLPYEIFQNYYDKLVSFSYVVVTTGGAIEVSLKTGVTYIGGVISKPDPNVKRGYFPCIVHTSLGIKTNNIIEEYSLINYDGIRFRQNGSHDPKKGLFMAIKVSDSEEGALPSNATVTQLNVYVDAPSGGPYKNGNFTNSYTQSMPTFTDSETGGKYILFNVPCCDLVNFAPREESGGVGNISFDYDVLVDGKKKYGKIWQGFIDSRTNDQPPCQE
ncbi:hypothetical protein KKJ17_18195 [Xenorhabdus bovienii]|uniref:hypothetical protein n=1 Tax=Xenorhabdus bovienii TaxID=40576 RepID=UPI0023B31D3F|nr:hypothetical protein [Xenorhabdus bovienii]MDE9519599.1 hypothetical protein [Xenorhabdus bovienii]